MFALHHRRFSSPMARLSIVTLLMSIGLASMDTVWSLYIKSLVGSEAWVGIITAVYSLASIVLSLYLVPFFECHSSRSLVWKAILLSALGCVTLALTRSLAVFAIVALFLILGAVTRFNAMGVLVRNQATKKSLSKLENLMYGIGNIGWLVGPLIAGLLLNEFGMNAVFFLAAFFLLLAIVEFLGSSFKEKKVEVVHRSITQNMKDFFSQKKMLFSYFLSMGMQVWWAMIYIFVPLYIINNGLSLIWVGFFLFGITIPLVVLELVMSRFASSIDAKFFFVLGYSVLFLGGVAAFLVPNPVWVLSILVAASAGAAMIEPVTETYFFKCTKGKDEKRFYAPFMTSFKGGMMIGQILGAGILFLLPFKFLFLGAAIEMAVFVVIALRAPVPK